MTNVQDAGNKFVIVRKGMIINCGLYDNFNEAVDMIKNSIFRNEIESLSVMTFKEYVDSVQP